jgi:hypothetical protein
VSTTLSLKKGMFVRDYAAEFSREEKEV